MIDHQVDATSIAPPALYRTPALVVAVLLLLPLSVDAQRRWSVSVAAGPTTGWLPYVEYDKDHLASWSLGVDGYYRVGGMWELGLGGGYHRLADQDLPPRATAYTYGGGHLAAMARMRGHAGSVS